MPISERYAEGRNYETVEMNTRRTCSKGPVGQRAGYDCESSTCILLAKLGGRKARHDF